MNKNSVVSVATIIDDYSQNLVLYLQEATSILSKNFQNYEIILILRKSSIKTRNELKNGIQHLPKIRLVQLANNCDEDIAYSAALNTAIGDAVVLMDFNQDPLEMVPIMIKKILQEETEVVIGHNVNKNREALWCNLLSIFFYKFASLLCEQSVDFDRTHFSCYSRTAVNFILQYKSNIRNLRLLRQLLGLETMIIDYSAISIQTTSPNNLARRLFSRVEEIFNLSVKPLRVVAISCFFLATLNTFYILYVLLVKFFGKNIAPGWAALSLTQSVVFLVLFFSIGIIACYLNIISQEIQRRPLYTIVNEWFSNNTLYDFSRKNIVDS
ncbi:MAG TPA: glycosyltransferase [Gammaproteobacteria bacterium]|nr:glycosyltransferase [Gammaproteobacteria bacterium]